MHRFFTLFSILIALFGRSLAADSASRTFLPPGRLVAVAADTTGIYQLTYAELRQLGFEAPEHVSVLGYGAIEAASHYFSDSPDSLCFAPSLHTSDHRLLFYAEGPVRASMQSSRYATVTRNHTAQSAIYFLTDTHTAPNSMPLYNYTPGLTTAKPFAVLLAEREAQNPACGGAVFHGPRLGAGDSESFTFDIQGFDTDRGTAALAHCDAAFSSCDARLLMPVVSGGAVTATTPFRIGANNDPSVLWLPSSAEASFNCSEDASIQFTVHLPADFDGNYAAIDKTWVIYPHNGKVPRQGELFINFTAVSGRRNFILQADSDTLCVWNITDPTAVQAHEIRTDADGFTHATFATPDRQPLRFVAFNPRATHRCPRITGPVSDAALHGAATPDMLIITTRAMQPHAQELARIHSIYRGADVLVACQDDIFNEFSFGVRTPAALRRFVRFLYKQNTEKLRHIVLYGPSSWKNTDSDMLVCYQCENSSFARDNSTCYVSDLYFGMVSDNFNPAETEKMPQQVSVGRIPARNGFEAEAYNRKSLAVLTRQPSPAAFRRVVKLSDTGDNAAHFNHSEAFGARFTGSGFTVLSADNLLFPPGDASHRLARLLADGCGLVHYTGHGNPTALSAEKVLNGAFVASNRYSYAPLAVISSCDLFPFDREASLAEYMVRRPDGGAAGVIASGRTVLLDYNQALSLAIAEAYATATHGTTGADILMKARNAMLADGISNRMAVNTMCYNYCGDPALPLDIPDHTATLSFDGHILSGTIDNAPDFSGTVCVDVFGSPTAMATLPRSADDGAAMTILADENLIARFSTAVDKGSFALPVTVDTDTTVRFTVSAVDTARQLTAAGSLSSAAPVHPTASDTPEIIDLEAVYTADGMLHIEALIYPSARGLVVAQSAIGTGIALYADGKSIETPSVHYDSDGLVRLAADLPDMPFGRHSVRLTVRSNGGESHSAETSVMCEPDHLAATLSVQGPDDDGCYTFDIDNAAATCNLVIYDADGNTVWRTDSVGFPLRCRLCDDAGNPLSPGRYRAAAMLSDPGRRGSTNRAEIIILPARY